MSVIKFEIKEDHLKLVKNLNVDRDSLNGINDDPIIGTDLFGDDNILEDIYLIVYGKNDARVEDVDPWDDEETPWTDDELAYMKQLLSELPTALDIVLYTASFEVGTYRTKSYVREWKKID